MSNHTELLKGDSISLSYGDKLVAKSKSSYIGDFKIMFKNAMLRATKEAYEATPTLNVLMANVERDNLVRLRHTRIAKALNVSTQTVERHLKKLRDLKLIEADEAEDGKVRAIFNWRICPYLAWKGSTDNMPAYINSLAADHPWRTYNNSINEVDLNIKEIKNGLEKN